MGCEKRPYLCGILILGSLALFFNVVGFVTPGWLILRRSIMEDESIFEIKGQLIDHGGVHPLPEVQDEDLVMRKRRSHAGSDSSSDDSAEMHHHADQHPLQDHHNAGHRSHHRPHPPNGSPRRTGEPKLPEESNEDINDERQTVEEWVMEATSKTETFEVRTSFGLWYSTLCVHKSRHGDYDSEEKLEEKDNGDDKKGKRKEHCVCKRVSTKCALYYAFIYENNLFKPKTGGILSSNNFGYASLTEHRVENSLALAFLVLGLISAIVGFRKVNGCRYAGAACVIFMILAAFLTVIPVARLSHYSVLKTQRSNQVFVHVPYSVIAAGVGALFALIAALVTVCGLMEKSRRASSQGWYQFNNELESPNEKKEKSSVYLTADAQPVKAGLYDVCDFSDIKPVEEVKKPVEEDDPDDCVF